MKKRQGNDKITSLPPDSDSNGLAPIDFFSKSIMAAPYGYVITDCGRKDIPVIFVNQAFHKITGYKAKEVLGKNCRILLGKDTEQSSLEQIRDAVKNGRKCTSVVRNYKKDGCLFYNELSMIPICDRSGKVTHCVWMQRDITAQIETTEKMATQIAQKEERFAAYMDNSSEAIWRIDFKPPISLDASESQQVQGFFDNGIFAEANDIAASVYGLTQGREVIGRPLKEFMKDFDPDNLKRVVELVQNKFIMDNLISKETSTDGSLKIILNNIKPSIQKGKVTFIWGASLDVSNLFKAQEDLKRSEKKLKKQKKELEKKNIALKELIVHIGLDKKEFKDRISANIQHLVLPSLDKMALNGLKEESIEQHRKTLENITSSFGLKMSDNRVKLSPREIEVCNFVKNGLSSKEISRLLNIALHTVEKHRRMARSKLGLANKGINLHTYLNSL
jgi:PAS domain S-box-containing protein